MSNRNSIAAKSNRRVARRAGLLASPLALCERRPASQITLASSAEILCDPKHKCSAVLRRTLMASRQDVIMVPRRMGTSDAVRTFHRLASATLTQVMRRQKQHARRAATAKYLLADMDENSPFRPAMEAEQKLELRRFKQATAELKARELHATGRLGVTLAEQRMQELNESVSL